MDSFSELDDCINTLEQLQLTLDFETSTVKHNPKINNTRYIHTKPSNRHFQATSNVIWNEHQPDLTERNIVNKHDPNEVFQEDYRHFNSRPENLDLQSVSVRRPKLSLTTQISCSPFSTHECDSSDFPTPPSPLIEARDNISKSFSVQTFQKKNSLKTNSSLSLINSPTLPTSNRKQSANCLKLSSKPLVEPFNNLRGNLESNTNSQSSSQFNVHNVTETVVRFFTSDKTTKAILVNEEMTVEQVIKILMEKHFWIPSLKSAVVEKVPSLKMERFFEEHEILLSCINSWPSKCANMIFFEPREEPFGLFENSKDYLGDNYPPASIDVDAIKKLFLAITADEHEYQDYIYIKKHGENSWKRKLCLLNHHGMFSIDKKKSKSSSPTTVLTFTIGWYLYTSTGGWTRQWDAPTPFGFAYKPYNVIDPRSNQIIMFCAGDEVSMKRWCSNIRLCIYKNQILNNYQHEQDRSTYYNNFYSSDLQLKRVLSLTPSTPTTKSKNQSKSRNS